MKAVGVFFLDRFSDGFATALEAAEAAAELAADYVGVASAGVGFVWADAPCQEAFARTLGVSDPSVSLRFTCSSRGRSLVRSLACACCFSCVSAVGGGGVVD